MDVRCEKCGTEYEFDENRVGDNGVTVKCTACGYVFKVRRPRRTPVPRATTSLGKGPQGREWLVRKPDRQIIAFRELTTLQKWIVEGRIARDDEISKNGETWKRLGNILEIEPFFSVYERARALNELIERGAIEGKPIELRGSEVLATMSPVSSIPLEGELPPNPRLGERSIGASSPPTSGSQGTHGAAAARSDPRSDPRYPIPERASPHPSTAPSNGIGPKAATPISTQSGRSLGSAGLGTGRAGGDVMDRGEPHSTGLLGPGALDTPTGLAGLRGGRPLRDDISSDPLGIALDDSGGLPRVDVVERFERQQRLRRTWGVAIAIVGLGAGGGAALAKLGPSGNPLQVLAERYGLLQPRIVDDGASRHIEEAHHAFDLDTLESLEKAEKLLELAESLRPGDASVPADRALVLITRADALRRAAADVVAPSPGAEGSGSPANQERAVKAGGELASQLLRRAFDLAKSAYQGAPEGFEPVRALAEYYRVQRDPVSFERELTRGKAMVDKSAVTDPSMLYIEAASMMSLGPPTNEDLEKAIHLLGQALSIRPSMNRARVLVARIAIERGDIDSAKAEIERVLARAPNHTEAKWLKDLADRRRQEKEGTALRLSPAGPGSEGTTPAPSAQGTESGQEGRREGGGAEEGATSGNTKAAAEGDAAGKAFESLMSQADRHRERDRPKKALQAYERAADLRPSSAEPLAGMGWSYIDLGKPEAALHVFRRALNINDRYADAYYGQAEAYRLLGQTGQAIEAYEKYLARAPNGAERRAAERALEILRNK